MTDKNTIAKVMASAISSDYKIDPTFVVEVPSDGCKGHMGSCPWKVYAARAGEFTILAHVYEDGSIHTTVV